MHALIHDIVIQE